MKNSIFCIDELCKARAGETLPQILILIFAFPLFHSKTIQLCQTSFALVLVKKSTFLLLVHFQFPVNQKTDLDRDKQMYQPMDGPTDQLKLANTSNIRKQCKQATKAK